MITDYKSSDVRDPAKARQRAKDSLQLTIYAMGYEAMTGRLPDAVALHFLDSGTRRARRAVDRKRVEKARETIRTAARGIRAREFGPKPDYLSCTLLRLPRDLPVERRALTAVDGLPPEVRASVNAVVERDASRARSSRATTSTCCGRCRTAAWTSAYADPPFATGGTRRLTTIRTGEGDRTRRGFGGREYRYEVVSDLGYADDLPLDEHLAALRERVVEVHRVLAPHGSLYLHVDWRTSHHVRLLLDEVFGPERFLNEIVWAYDYGGRPRDRWPRKHDTILWYARGDRWLFDREAIDRVPYMAPGPCRPREGGPRQAADRRLVDDDRATGLGGADRVSHPEAGRLLERIVAASSRPGDLVLDPYAGSGTTGIAARRLGRRWLLVDRNPEAVAIARVRHRAGRAAGQPVTIRAITLDFGNTLVPVPAAALEGVVAETAGAMAAASRSVRRGRGAPRVARGARAAVPRGGPGLPRGGPRPAPRADPRPAPRDAGAAARITNAGTTTRPPS